MLIVFILYACFHIAANQSRALCTRKQFSLYMYLNISVIAVTRDPLPREGEVGVSVTLAAGQQDPVLARIDGGRCHGKSVAVLYVHKEVNECIIAQMAIISISLYIAIG